jgi:predicted permease
MFGERGTIGVVVTTLTTNMVFILWLSFFSNRKNKASHLQNIWSTFVNMFCKNPVLIAPVIDGVFSYYSLTILTPIHNLFSMLAPSVAPVALFAMGHLWSV